MGQVIWDGPRPESSGPVPDVASHDEDLPDRQPDPGGEIFQDDAQPHAWLTPQYFNENTAKSQGLKVGWSLRAFKDGKWRLIEALALKLNPQGISRVLGSRTQMSATKGGFYVDDFGPAPGQINVRQLIAGGQTTSGGATELFTPREEVQRFLKRIYLPATNNVIRANRVRVYFHDNHLERGFEEQVYFPPNSLTLERDVNLHNVWRLEFQMVSLEQRPYAELDVDKTPQTNPGLKTRVYIVRGGDTLDKIISTLLGKRNKNSPSKRKAMLATLLRLNPWLKKKRKVKVDDKTITVKPHKVVPGDRLKVPV